MEKTKLQEILIDFLLYLRDKDFISDYVFEYEKEAKKYLKKNSLLPDENETGRLLKEMVIKFDHWREEHPNADVDEFLTENDLMQY